MARAKKIYNFMGIRKLALAFSTVLVLVSIASLASNGLKFGLDFTGGSLVEVGYAQAVDLDEVRQRLRAQGFEDAVVQTFGSARDVLIRLQVAHDPQLGDKVLAALRGDRSRRSSCAEMSLSARRWGRSCVNRAVLGMLLALFMVMVYLAFRFQLKFSLGAVIALIHDVLIVLGLFSLLQIEFDLIRMSEHQTKNTAAEHMESFYRPFSEVEASGDKYDGLIITGAPIEHLDFDAVTYWDELTRVFTWTQTHVHSTFGVCWGGMAMINHFHGVKKHLLPAKAFGCFRHRNMTPASPYLRGFPTIA